MSDPIPPTIYTRIKEWLERNETCQINLHVQKGAECAKIVQADRQLPKETVKAT